MAAGRRHEYPQYAEEIEEDTEDIAILMDLRKSEEMEAAIEQNFAKDIENFARDLEVLRGLNKKQRDIIYRLIDQKRQRNRQRESEIKANRFSNRNVTVIGPVTIGNYQE